MGNRGVLHDAEGRIRRPWKVDRWLLCRLAFRGRHRPIMAPGRWTELFFLDEATGLAAGHRPCCECQRDRFDAFRNAWVQGNAVPNYREALRAPEIDHHLHAARLTDEGAKRTYTADLDALPDGVMVVAREADAVPCLVLGSVLRPWSLDGYGPPIPRTRGQTVTVLTPRPTVQAIAAGYRPLLHPTAELT